MLVPDAEWIYAPHLVFDARRVLAPVRAFADRVHASAYSIPIIAMELGAAVSYQRESSLTVIGVCTRAENGAVIALNDAIEGTDWDMAGLIHELGHAVTDEICLRCTGRLQLASERNAWLRGIYAAISRVLAEAVLDREIAVRDVAARCSVPPSIVHIRTGLSVAVGEREGDVDEAYETVRRELLVLEQWFDQGRARGFREWATV
jgi:hypothetical protein